MQLVFSLERNSFCFEFPWKQYLLLNYVLGELGTWEQKRLGLRFVISSYAREYTKNLIAFIFFLKMWNRWPYVFIFSIFSFLFLFHLYESLLNFFIIFLLLFGKKKIFDGKKHFIIVAQVVYQTKKFTRRCRNFSPYIAFCKIHGQLSVWKREMKKCFPTIKNFEFVSLESFFFRFGPNSLVIIFMNNKKNS